MRTETITYEIYPVSELSPEAVDRAHSDWLTNHDYAWSWENRATLDKFCEIFRIKCHSWNYDGSTYHYHFSINDEEYIEKLSGHRLATYLWNNFHRHIFKSKYYHKNGKHRYSGIFLTKDCPLTGYCIDLDILTPIYEHMDKPNPSTSFHDLIDQCLDAFFKACRDDYKYCESMENFKEESEGNDWEYLSDGKLFS